MSKDFCPNELRKLILRMAYAGSSAHIACAFSLVEIFSILYKDHGNHHIILSKGHGVMVQYACLYMMGILKDEDLDNYLKDGTILKGECESNVRGIEVNSGSLGHGLSVGIGIALAHKIKKEDKKTFVIIGDGECNEGTIWEGIMFAAHHKLSNLIILVDNNKFQGLGANKDIINLYSLKDKFKSFGCEVLSANGHDLNEIEDKLNYFYNINMDRPNVLICDTIKGKGISFMENSNDWHYNKLDKKTYEAALLELK